MFVDVFSCTFLSECYLTITVVYGICKDTLKQHLNDTLDEITQYLTQYMFVVFTYSKLNFFGLAIRLCGTFLDECHLTITVV